VSKKIVDRRILHTKAMLQRALLSLISKKIYEAVTIKDICEAAHVSRSTFYAHYTSKDDLKRSGFEPLRKLLVDRQQEARPIAGHRGGGRLSFSLPMFEHARDHKEHYRALLGSRGGAVSLGTIRKMLSDLVRNELTTSSVNGSAEAVPPEFVVRYVVGAYMAVMTWWLDGGAKVPPERMDAMFRRLAIEGISPTL
jgi:AcrR family transcriptional regulator